MLVLFASIPKFSLNGARLNSNLMTWHWGFFWGRNRGREILWPLKLFLSFTHMFFWFVFL